MRRLLLLSCAVMIAAGALAQTAPSPTAFTVEFSGKNLKPGDKYDVTVSLRYIVFDFSKGNTPANEKRRVFDESMVEYARPGQSMPRWTVTVPESGYARSAKQVVQFGQPLVPVPNRMTAVVLEVSFRQETTKDGKPVSMSRRQEFPVLLGEAKQTLSRCVSFERVSEGLALQMREQCPTP